MKEFENKFPDKEIIFKLSENEKLFKGICIAMDIKEAIDIFRDKGYSVHKIERGEQVNSSEEIGILLVEKTTIISRNRKGNI